MLSTPGGLPESLCSLHGRQSFILPGKGLSAPGHQRRGWDIGWGEHILQKGQDISHRYSMMEKG